MPLLREDQLCAILGRDELDRCERNGDTFVIRIQGIAVDDALFRHNLLVACVKRKDGLWRATALYSRPPT